MRVGYSRAIVSAVMVEQSAGAPRPHAACTLLQSGVNSSMCSAAFTLRVLVPCPNGTYTRKREWGV
jgi:hypothetical protein